MELLLVVLSISLQLNSTKMNDKKRQQIAWYKENQPLGKSLGYPDCCIQEFCDQPPSWMKGRNPSKDDKRRMNAATLAGWFTGFVPCSDHAKQIVAGKLNLEDLIENRDTKWFLFPMENF